MMLFVVVTAILNIGLGYGLALYLGHAPLPKIRFAFRKSPAAAEEALAPEPVVTTDAPTAPAAPSTPATSAPALATAADSAPSGEVAEVAESAAESPAAGSAAPSPEKPDLEHEVLAGIEEFRNQLAQMKAQPAAPADADADLATAPA